MADRGCLGCVGVLVAIVAGLVVGWLCLDLLLTVYGSFSAGGPLGPFRDAVVWHQVGQLAIFTSLTASILALVMRPWIVAGWLPLLRPVLWGGAVFEIAAWLALPGGSRMAMWALLLAILAIPAPWAIARAARAEARPPQL